MARPGTNRGRCRRVGGARWGDGSGCGGSGVRRLRSVGGDVGLARRQPRPLPRDGDIGSRFGHHRSATLAAVAWRQAAEAICHTHDSWVGTGKWLHRYIHRLDPAGTDRLEAAYVAAVNGDRAALVTELEVILDGLGGRLDITGRLLALPSGDEEVQRGR
jgi:hypothetical protein